MKIHELIARLSVLDPQLEVCVYESEPDDYLPVSEVQECLKDIEPHVRLLTGLEPEL